MNKANIKKEIVKLQLKKIEEYEFANKQYWSQMDLQEDETKDPEDYSHSNEANEIRENYQAKINDAKLELNLIKNLPEEETSSVDFGSIVKTDRGVFFISVSGYTVLEDGIEIMTISAKAPIFSSMQGLKKGDSFVFKDNQYKITNVM